MFRRLLKNPVSALALAYLLILVVLAVAGPALVPDDPNEQDLLGRLQPPGSEHWLGTDEFGRDQLSRLIVGARVSLLAVLEAVVIAASVGVPLGIIAGWSGRWLDAVLGRTNDALMSVPALIFALTIVAALGPGLSNAMIAVGIVFVPRFFRVARASTQHVRHETFIEASEAIGCPTRRTVWRHVFPNVLSPVVVQASVMLGSAVIAEATLSFLGLGVQPPTASWGSMLTSATANFTRAPFLVWPPGIMIASTVLAFIVLGDHLREMLDSRTSIDLEGV